MTAHSIVFLSCDDCGNAIGMSELWPNIHAARRNAAAAFNWQTRTNEQGHTRDLCEDCA